MGTVAISARRSAAGTLLVTGLMLAAVPTAGAAGLRVMPFPGTPDASPHTCIIFPSITPAELASVTVTGSSSGPDPGRLLRLPDRAGVTFVPERPFTPGERVWVSADLASPAAAAALGSGRTGLSYSFTVGTPELRRPRPGAFSVARSSERPNGMTFHSLPGLHPPTVKVRGRADPDSGDIFITPRNSYQRRVQIQHGPMILNRRGQLVWFQRIPAQAVVNLEVKRYRGHPVLTWWQGNNGFTVGEDVIANSAYHTVAVLQAGPASAHYATDAHDFQITPQGTALVQAFTGVHADLRSLGGPADGVVQDDIIQELDIKTGQVLWEWHSYGHIPLSASYLRPYGNTWFDYLHMNSVQELPDGNILISARNTWGIYEISKRTGRVIWSLGGKHSSFASTPRFSWQHDAHMVGHTLTLFDDASDGPSRQEAQSSGLVIRLDPHAMTAVLVRRYTHSPALLSVSQGSVQLLRGGDVFIGWGAGPQFSEYTRSGRQIFDASLVWGLNTYRAYRFPWVGHPTTRPALALTRGSGHGVALYVSWNGATQVAAWRVLGGSSAGALRVLAGAATTGFETRITLSTARRYFAVQALSAGGRVLGTSLTRAAPAR